MSIWMKDQVVTKQIRPVKMKSMLSAVSFMTSVIYWHRLTTESLPPHCWSRLSAKRTIGLSPIITPFRATIILSTLVSIKTCAINTRITRISTMQSRFAINTICRRSTRIWNTWVLKIWRPWCAAFFWRRKNQFGYRNRRLSGAE